MNKLEKITQELQAPEYAELVEKQDYPAIASKLNQKPLIDNPEPQATVPKMLTTKDADILFELLSEEEAQAIAMFPNMLERLTSSFSQNDRRMILQSYKIIKSKLTPENQAAIENYLNQTEPDPNYQPQIQGQSRAEVLGISVDEHDIQAALNPMGVLEDAIIEQ